MDLGDSLTAMVQRRFVLTKPYGGNLVVKLNGVVLNPSSTNGYTFDSATNSVTLYGLNLENLSNFKVGIEYKAR